MCGSLVCGYGSGLLLREVWAVLRMGLSLSPGLILAVQGVFRWIGSERSCRAATLAKLSRCDAAILDGAGDACTFFGGDAASAYVKVLDCSGRGPCLS